MTRPDPLTLIFFRPDPQAYLVDFKVIGLLNDSDCKSSSHYYFTYVTSLQHIDHSHYDTTLFSVPARILQRRSSTASMVSSFSRDRMSVNDYRYTNTLTRPDFDKKFHSRYLRAAFRTLTKNVSIHQTLPTNVDLTQNHLIFRAVCFLRRLYVAQTFRLDARGTQIRHTKQLTDL